MSGLSKQLTTGQHLCDPLTKKSNSIKFDETIYALVNEKRKRVWRGNEKMLLPFNRALKRVTMHSLNKTMQS